MCHELEYITADGLLRIDLAVVDRRIAIEFGAQAQSASLLPIMPVVPRSGRMRMRDGLLSAIGWRVASIPLFECQWDKLHQPEQMDVLCQPATLARSCRSGDVTPAARAAAETGNPGLLDSSFEHGDLVVIAVWSPCCLESDSHRGGT